MHRSAARRVAAALKRVPLPSVAVLVALLFAIGVVEMGWRDPAPGLAVAVPVPGPLGGIVAELRSVPQRHVDDARAGAVAAGVVFGRADDVPVGDQQAFLDSGLWHLLAASGQNVALVTGCCILLARGLGAGRTTGSMLALLAIPAYVLVVGGGASIVRAGATGMLVIVAWLAGRLPDARHVLVAVAAITCWAWPGAHRGLGFQLSFACVAALVAGAVPVTRELRARGVPAWLAAGLAATALCSLATAPILQLRTGAAPLAGIVANVVAVPLAGAILVVGLAGSIATVVLTPVVGDRLGDVLLWPTGVAAELLLRIAGRAADLPAAQSSSPLATLVVPLLALVAALVPRARRHALALVPVAIVGSVVLGPGSAAGGGSSSPPSRGTLRIAVLDVGQGDATLVADGDAAILVDTGPPDGRVVDRLRELGVSDVDGIVLTHDSLDHRGGLEAAVAALEPDWIARPAHAPGPWRRVEQLPPRLVDLCVGGSFAVGRAAVDVLHPPCDGRIRQRTDDLHNDGAMVLLVTRGPHTILLPADAEAPVLLDLPLPPVDVLRVAHHASADPALARLLERTGPRVAAISVGEGNGYGHPTRQVLDDLARAGVTTRRTDRHGTIELHADGERLELLG